MPILGGGNVPLVYLFVCGLIRVTGHGETLLVGGSIKKTLSKLDFMSMPDITNKTIKTLTKVGLEIVELCNHNCFCVTYTSIDGLASIGCDGVVRETLR